MSSKKSIFICLFVYFFMLLSSGAFYFISTILPEFAPYIYIVIMLFMSGAGFILFWSLTVEGNTWVARRLGRENLGIAEFHEQGAYFNSTAVNFSLQEVQYRGESYKLAKDAIEYRANGIPYIHFNVGDSEPLYITKVAKQFNSTENTGFLRDMTTLIEYMMRNQMYRLLIILAVVTMALVILSAIFIHFVSITPIDEKATYIAGQVGHIAQALTSPTPSVIPSG